MSKNGLIVKTDGSIHRFVYDGLSSLQDAVQGYIEAISLDDFTIFVNEEGKLNDLPVNPVATLFWKIELKKSGFKLNDVICGDAVILGGCDDEGETLGLTDSQLKLFNQ